MLVQLLYASRAVYGADTATINAILQKARLHNPDAGITGVLCHSQHYFLQLLEGGRDQVNQLYARILRDQRHSDVTLLHYEEIQERHYSGWVMGQTNLDKLNAATVLRYSPLPVFDPYAMPASSTLALIEELASSAAVQGGA
ncbi:blue light sensor protein [Pseudoduganella sp. DS3]|uniref:Blue light sensor protein n=1 Tax=Pseudoduganella guangdongensis TaxID=2692179 RepID=A0A6N9HG64_9BURK|nr:BLUF domain-containing protein [Pseudoduganella guangdongensis]MYN02012.1 blue light sensor protein [Pseudoduganella guangdongensis]